MKITEEDEPMAGDKITEIEAWLFGVELELKNESISYGELAQIDYIYESIKEFMKGE